MSTCTGFAQAQGSQEQAEAEARRLAGVCRMQRQLLEQLHGNSGGALTACLAPTCGGVGTVSQANRRRGGGPYCLPLSQHLLSVAYCRRRWRWKSPLTMTMTRPTLTLILIQRLPTATALSPVAEALPRNKQRGSKPP